MAYTAGSADFVASSSPMNSIYLKPGRERPVIRMHPWIFSGAIAEVRGSPAPGEFVDIFSSDGTWLARGDYSPHSQIRSRLWSWDQSEAIDQTSIRSRLERAVGARDDLSRDPRIDAYREVHAESDHLPGLIVDRYGPFRVVQFLSQGAEGQRQAILEWLGEDPEVVGIYERSDVDVRHLEGLQPQTGSVWGQDPPDLVTINEVDVKYLVDLRLGHKTGFYLDQRSNRQQIRNWVRGDVLDAFCYSGAFSVSALRAGASSITSVDSSAPALELTVANLEMNLLDDDMSETVEADVFSYLRTCRDSRKSFDTIILDPPKFAATSAQVERASRGYKDINLLAFKLLRPGGVLITFSCSGGVGPELFQKVIADAALDAGVDASIIAVLSQADDHPIRLQFPESRYLKGLVCRVR